MHFKTQTLAFALLAAGLMTTASRPSSAEQEKAPGSVTVTVELWRTSDAETVAAIEALTNANPADADAVHFVLLAAKEEAIRGCRFVTPTKFGKAVKQSDHSEKAVRIPAGAGSTSSVSFGGFQSEGSSLVMRALLAANKQIEVDLDLSSSGAGKLQRLADNTVIPGKRSKSKVKGTVVGPSGVTRLFTSQSESNELVVVFVMSQLLD